MMIVLLFSQAMLLKARPVDPLHVDHLEVVTDEASEASPQGREATGH